MNKIAFVASGGGMACAYGAGVAWALQDLGIKPDILVGSSGSAGTLSYFACGQADLAARLWVEEVSNQKVVRSSPLYFDIDLIVDSMKERFGFEEPKLRGENVELYLATTDYKTGKLIFFNNHDDVDWYEVIRASMAVPIVYNKKIIIQNREYIDGDLGSTVDDYIDLAISKGASQIYVCDTTTPLTLGLLKLFPFFTVINKEFLRLTGPFIKKYFRFSKKYKNQNIVILRPSRKILLDITNNRQVDIKKNIDIGYRETTDLLTNTSKIAE